MKPLTPALGGASTSNSPRKIRLPHGISSITPPMADPNLSSFIWSVADLLRGDYKQSEYGKVILPFTVLRRLDCVLEATKPAVLAEKEIRKGIPKGRTALALVGRRFDPGNPARLGAKP